MALQEALSFYIYKYSESCENRNTTIQKHFGTYELKEINGTVEAQSY